jgi:SAM-dependent methyltransferase
MERALESRSARIRQSFGIAERILCLCCVAPEAAFRGVDQFAEPTRQWSLETALAMLRTQFAGFDDLVRDARVLDYGCGDGFQSIALRDAGAKEVVGVDTNERRLTVARRLAGERSGISFSRTSPTGFDVAISLNSFEHFPRPAENLREMAEALRPGGVLLITFSPPWLSPWGAHMNFFCKLPWVHLIFSEKTVNTVRLLYRETGNMTYEPDMNRMTVAKFERLISDSGLSLRHRKYEAVKGLSFLLRLPYLRELFCHRATCLLQK